MHSGIKDAKRRSQPSVTVQASMKAQQTSKRALSAGPCLATPGLGSSAVRPVSDQLEGGEAEVKRNVLEKVKRWQGRKNNQIVVHKGVSRGDNQQQQSNDVCLQLPLELVI